MFKILSLVFGSLCVSASLWLVPSSRAEPFPNTKALTDEGDLSAKQVAGMHKYLDRALKDSVEKRQAMWKLDKSSSAAYAKSVEPNRARFKKLIGVVDKRVPPNLEYVGTPDQPALIAETDKYKVFAVRWAVLPGVDGEGLLLEPKDKPIGNVVAIPEADWTPEMIVGLAPGVPKDCQFARLLAENGCRVLVPTIIDRKDDLSANPKLNRATNQPHREFIYRMAYQMGRHIIGYEVQKVLAGVDWFFARDGLSQLIGVCGYGEGGLLALASAACDPRIQVCGIAGYFGPREGVADEPIYRNVWGLLTEFGDAELCRLLIASPRLQLPKVEKPLNLRPMFLFSNCMAPEVTGPPPAKPGRGGAAPGALKPTATDQWLEEKNRIGSQTFIGEYSSFGAKNRIEFG
ncbi:MAG: dienelactone hydrolase family protein, partial [Planctomycetia bacterium]|nr:dienelactone hydrolase family protein [Planctomycetia bacterium]